ncbi:WD40-repeat-containing domain protein [Lentinula raphanica]|nr:WD40-repeat-containing domain protein [Lentinula raphanica]
MPSKWLQERHLTVREGSSIDHIALSRDAHYLAVAYGTCVDIWDIKNTTNTAPLAHYKPDVEIRPISFLVWSLESHRLAVCFEGGLVCVIAMNVGAGVSSLVVGFRISGQVQQSRVFSAFLRENVLAVVTGKNVEIRCFLDNDGDPRWDLFKSLPAAASSTTFSTSSVGDIQSIHSFAQDRILVSYDNGIAHLWRFERSDEVSFTYSHEATMSLPGVINDVCPTKGAILVAAAGTYQVLHLGSTSAQSIFIPRDPITNYPQNVGCARYLSDDLIIGAGAGQLILWNADLGNRLQNLRIHDAPATHHMCTAYRADEDSGWIVTAHEGGKIICWKTIEYAE